MSFKWLKDNKKLKEGLRPRCQISEEIRPIFSEENVLLPRLTEEGIFVQELSYYRPSFFCVDSRLDTSQSDFSLQPSYSVVLACRDRRQPAAQCPLSSPACHSQCCEAWEVWEPAERKCQLRKHDKSKHRNKNRSVYSLSLSPTYPTRYIL